jgi:hypothetical protein
MKFSVSVLLSLIPLLAHAQNFEGEPACAIPCLSAAIQQVGCPLTDQGCACASQAAIGNAAVGCFITACAPADLVKASSVGVALCTSYYASLSSMGTKTVVTSATPTASATASTNTASLTSTATTSGSSSTAANDFSIQTQTTVATTSTTVLSGSVTRTSGSTTPVSSSATVASTTTSRAAAAQGVLANSAGGFAGLVLGLLALL